MKIAKLHLQKRLDIIPETEKFERMEALADLAHSHSSLGELEQAQALLIESLELATELDELSGILVARWGLADLAEISNQPDEGNGPVIGYNDGIHGGWCSCPRTRQR